VRLGSLTKREIREMITIPTLTKTMRFMDLDAACRLDYSRPTDVSDSCQRLAAQYAIQNAEAEASHNGQQARDSDAVVSRDIDQPS
jgi:hypothetical protein